MGHFHHSVKKNREKHPFSLHPRLDRLMGFIVVSCTSASTDDPRSESRYRSTKVRGGTEAVRWRLLKRRKVSRARVSLECFPSCAIWALGLG
ncbi:hypothetical protein ES332_A12G190400v1 [Gossypium tomentosum]|uniref:Uncharacterized protein n=1 Tax=Gossypium tomentosum TaxID=34277 RepID=A0A5D2N1K1_GOSTO|nr:hypothetical protein ES332_A12G190400v1 [Gossypium tomentosum]